MGKKREVIHYTERLPKEKRKNYKKDNPGYRLSFLSRYPDASMYISAIAILLQLIYIISLVIYRICNWKGY